jgi:general secretion pathway protein E
MDVRVSILPATYGEVIELRLLTGKAFLSLDQLGLDEGTKAAILRAIQFETGMIIVTGSTGTGKTTTLYAVLKSLNTPDKKIITIEDPVEYKISGIEQIQVQPDRGFDFPQALRAVLRQDPDIIMVGEIRDKETAEIAINASLTGHLVLTTLHANSAPATFARLIEMGAPAHLLSDAIRLIIAQKLVKRPEPKEGEPGRMVIAQYLEPTAEYTELIKQKASIREFEELFGRLGGKTQS